MLSQAIKWLALSGKIILPHKSRDFKQNNKPIQRCIQSASLRPGTHSFSFWTHRIWNKRSNWMQKRNQIFMQITNARKNVRAAYFTRKLNISISPNGEMCKFLKFQGKPLFSDFCSRMISFCQQA